MSAFRPRESSRKVARTEPSVPGSPVSGICISRVHFSPTAIGPRESIAGISPNIRLSSPSGSSSSTISIAPSVETLTITRLACMVRRLRSASEPGDAGLIATESVIDCISVPPDVHCWAIARVNTSIDVVIDPVGESWPPRLVVPVISTDCDRCIRRVSPMWGLICSSTGWPNAELAANASAAVTTCLFLKAIRIVFRRGLDACCHWPRRWLRRNDFAKLRLEVRLHLLGPREQRGIARPDDLFLGVERGDLLHPRQRDGRVERAQRAQNGRVQRDIACLRVALGAFAALHHR